MLIKASKFSETGQIEYDHPQSSIDSTSVFCRLDQADLEANDQDFGSTGVLILPDQGGAHPHELIVGGKEGNLYVVDRDDMGGFNNGSDNVVQTVAAERAAADGNTAYGGVNDQTSESGHLHFAKIASLFHRN